MDVSFHDLVLVLAFSGASVALEFLRLSFYFRLRPGLRGAPIALRILDRVIGSILWRSACFLLVILAVRARAMFGGADDVLLICILLFLYFGAIDPVLNHLFARWFDDGEAEYKLTIRSLLAAPLRMDRNAWIDLEGTLRKVVCTRTKWLRERASETLDELIQQEMEAIERHVKRSRKLTWLGFPPYKPGDWYRHMRASDPRRLEILVNSLGFSRTEALAKQHPAWHDRTRRGSERTPVLWKAAVRVGQSRIPCEVVDVSDSGLQARFTSSTCDSVGVQTGSVVQVEWNGAALPLHVKWNRTRAFGGSYA